MSIPVSCPHCLSVYHLRDEQEGKTVRCKKCENTFVVRPPGKTNTPDDEGPAGGTGQIQATRGGGTRARALPDDERPRRRRENEDEEEDAYVPPRKKGSVLPWVLGGFGAAFLVGLLMCGGLVYLVFRTGDDVIDDVVADAPGPGQAPANVDQALAALRSANPGRRRTAVSWLAQANPEEGRRPDVVQALEPIVTGQDGFGGDDAAARALAHWAAREQVPTLIRMLDSQSGGVRAAALEALGRLQDERAAAPLAGRLPHDRQGAARALEALGPAAEKEVLRYAFHHDGGCREEARRLLRGYGTRDSALTPQAVAALKDPEAGARKAAAEWLLAAPVDPARAAEVAAALEPMLQDSDVFAREPAGKALCRWATKENVPALIRCLDHDARNLRKAAADALANLKDERAAPALAQHLTRTFEAKQYGQALEALGPALAEKEVVKYFFDKNHDAQEEARRIARAFGTRPEVILGQAVADLKDAGADAERQTAVCTWLGQVPVEEKRRADVAGAIDPLVKSGNNWVKESALKALIVWATKDNVPTLIAVVENQDLGNGGMRGLAIQALGKIKDERAAGAVAVSLTNFFDREKAAAALEAMGPVAEKPVRAGLRNDDAQVRLLVCRILNTIGTKESLKDLQLHAAKDQDPAVRQEAALACAAIKARP